MKEFDDKAKYQADREGVLGMSRSLPTDHPRLAPFLSHQILFSSWTCDWNSLGLNDDLKLITVTELCHNWGTETDSNFKGYVSGNEEPGRGFGHICVSVDDLEGACKRFTDLGVKFKKRPEDGRMKVSRFHVS